MVEKRSYRKHGRPSKYRPDFCATARETLGKGHSLTALAGALKVTRQTVCAWMQEHGQFLDAVRRGQAAGALKWEEILMENAESGKGNSSTIAFGLKNRAAEDWADKQVHEHTGGDKPIAHTQVDTSESADFLGSVAKDMGEKKPASVH